MKQRHRGRPRMNQANDTMHDLVGSDLTGSGLQAESQQMTFSAAQFKSTVSGTSGGDYAGWFFFRVRELTQVIEQRLQDAIEFKVADVSGEIRGAAADLSVLLTLLAQVEEHCKNLTVYKMSITNARLRIKATLTANSVYLEAATAGIER